MPGLSRTVTAPFVYSVSCVLEIFRFQVLQCETSSSITERYGVFEKAVEEVAEKVVGRSSPCGMPSWVTDKTLKLRMERDKAKKRYLVVRTRQSRETWRKLNTSLNEFYKADELSKLQNQMEDLKVADEKGEYSTTWRLIHDIAG